MSDQRIQRTRARIRDALVTLLCEKPYQEVQVREIIGRAEVGRATFYSHFRDKEDLLVTLFLNMLDEMETHPSARAESIVPYAGLLLRHFSEARALCRSLQRSGKLDVLLRAGEARLRRSIEQRLEDTALGSPSLRAAFAAGAFFNLFRWWLAQGMHPPWQRMEEAYQQLVCYGLQGVAPLGGHTDVTSART